MVLVLVADHENERWLESRRKFGKTKKKRPGHKALAGDAMISLLGKRASEMLRKRSEPKMTHAHTLIQWSCADTRTPTRHSKHHTSECVTLCAHKKRLKD